MGPVHLVRGTTGAAVADLQGRLWALGFPCGGNEGQHAPGPGGGDAGVGAHFDARTEEAVRAFQRERGLRTDGVCGPQTWATLVEAGYRLGDRPLYLRRPKLRGDDVAELQRRLGALGFDAGRIDGIFGNDTVRALADFQRNVALPVDGICGRGTLDELERLRAHTSPDALLPGIREREHLRGAPRTLTGRRVAVGHHGELGAVVEAARRSLMAAGAYAITLFHPDGSSLAGQANAAGAEVYLGLGLHPAQPTCQVSFYRGYRQESAGGRRLAELLGSHLTRLPWAGGATVAGMSVPELRETRMIAVVCDLNAPGLAVQRAPEIATCLRLALASWVGDPWG